MPSTTTSDSSREAPPPHAPAQNDDAPPNNGASPKTTTKSKTMKSPKGSKKKKSSKSSPDKPKKKKATIHDDGNDDPSLKVTSPGKVKTKKSPSPADEDGPQESMASPGKTKTKKSIVHDGDKSKKIKKSISKDNAEKPSPRTTKKKKVVGSVKKRSSKRNSSGMEEEEVTSSSVQEEESSSSPMWRDGPVQPAAATTTNEETKKSTNEKKKGDPEPKDKAKTKVKKSNKKDKIASPKSKSRKKVSKRESSTVVEPETAKTVDKPGPRSKKDDHDDINHNSSSRNMVANETKQEEKQEQQQQEEENPTVPPPSPSSRLSNLFHKKVKHVILMKRMFGGRNYDELAQGEHQADRKSFTQSMLNSQALHELGKVRFSLHLIHVHEIEDLRSRNTSWGDVWEDLYYDQETLAEFKYQAFLEECNLAGSGGEEEGDDEGDWVGGGDSSSGSEGEAEDTPRNLGAVDETLPNEEETKHEPELREETSTPSVAVAATPSTPRKISLSRFQNQVKKVILYKRMFGGKDYDQLSEGEKRADTTSYQHSVSQRKPTKENAKLRFALELVVVHEIEDLRGRDTTWGDVWDDLYYDEETLAEFKYQAFLEECNLSGEEFQ